MTYEQFKAEWNGRRIDYDRVYAYQCVDLILQYVKECYGLPTGVSGNAIDYWNRPSAALLTKFDKIATTDCHKGDIVVLYGLTGNPYGHIGICDSQAATTVRLLEQNRLSGGDGLNGNAIGVYRDIAKSRIAGVLRPKVPIVPPPTPAPARQTVFLPSSARSWRLYPVGGSLVPGTEKATLTPYAYPPGLTYKIVSWVGDYAVVIDTAMFGRGVIWVRGTEAVIK